METILFIAIVLIAFIGALTIANGSRNDETFREEEDRKCTIDDYTYQAK